MITNVLPPFLWFRVYIARILDVKLAPPIQNSAYIYAADVLVTRQRLILEMLLEREALKCQKLELIVEDDV